MKKIFVIIFLLMFGLVTPVVAKKTSLGVTKDISITIKPEKIKEADGKGYLEIKDIETNKVWTMSYKDFDKLIKSRKNWRVVEINTPVIKEIYEEDNFIYIVFGYYDKVEDDLLGFKYNKNETVLSGKVLIHKKYLLSPDAKPCNVVFYQGLSLGLGVYSTIITIILAILIF